MMLSTRRIRPSPCIRRVVEPFTHVAKCAQIMQASSLRGVDVTADVEALVEGTLPPFNGATIGINIMPLGSAEVSTP